METRPTVIDEQSPAVIPGEIARYAEEASAEGYRDALARLGKEDPEAGHGLADELAGAALRAIAEGHPDPRGLAAQVLVVLSAEFPRWCA